jgi:hypothetical protein
MQEKSVIDHDRLLGSDHPDTLTIRNSLAVAYCRTGRTAEAIILFEQNLAGQERVLGSDHPDTRGTRYNLNRAWEA